MALIATRSQGADFKRVPQGVHLGRCFRVIDLGTQKTTWQGKEKWSRKVMFGWELFGEDESGEPLVMEDGRPMMISSRYTLSLGDNAAMRGMLEGWRGKTFTDEELAGFDLKAVLGQWCMVNVTHTAKDGKTYTNAAGVTPVPKMMRASLPKAVNAVQFFDVTEPDNAVFDSLSEKLQETIAACKEWNKESASRAASNSATTGGGTSFDNMDDDIPF
jgi:hypothetical protein